MEKRKNETNTEKSTHKYGRSRLGKRRQKTTKKRVKRTVRKTTQGKTVKRPASQKMVTHTVILKHIQGPYANTDQVKARQAQVRRVGSHVKLSPVIKKHG
jgi:RNA-splicing ligase RtcB